MGEEAKENRIRIVLVDEHRLFRESLAHFLNSETGLEVAGECGAPDEALRALKGSTPVDIVLLDLDLGAESGDAFMTAAREAGYQGHFLIVAAAADAHKAALAIRSGASGIFLKSEAPDRLVRAIRTVAGGEAWIEPKVVQMLADQLVNHYPQLGDIRSAPVLEDRERNVLLGILGGLTNRKIAEDLRLSESAVKNVVQQLFAKSGARKRSQLVRVALEGSLGATRQLIPRQSASRKVGNPRHPPAMNEVHMEQSHS
jgi:DNA-binding NarL/FixJ family response regulator